MKKSALIFLLLIGLVSQLAAQEKWVLENMHTRKPPFDPTKFFKVPVTYWENPNKEIRYLLTPVGFLAIGPNFRVLPNTNQQDEVILSSCTQNPNLLFGSANTTVGGSQFGQGCYVSTNGGLNWYGTDLMPNMPSSTSDPAPIIDKNQVFVFTTLNTVSTAFMIGSYSTNFGVNWSTPYTIYSGSSDKNLIATDDVPTSPYYGRTYTVWTKWTSPYPIVISWTTNSGVSWSSMLQINNSPSGLSQGADVIVGPNGEVYVTWSAQSGSVSDYVGFAKSTNGGTSWTVTENAYDANGIRTNSFNGWGVRVNDFPRIGVDKTGGPRNGWIYIVDAEQNLAPAGSDPDIIFHRSTNGGVTWSAGVRVNQDALNNGKVQFFPAIRVDESGGINVVYYDNRDFPSVGDSCAVYMSRSIDGGNTWTDVKVSDHNWKPKPEPGMGAYMGDYIGITSGNNKIWPFWFDDKSGSFQAWTCAVELGPSIVHTPLGNTEQTTGSRPVNCQINPAGSGINPSLTRLYYSKDNPNITNYVQMTNTGGTNWTANLPLSGAGLYRYYITTTDSLNRVATAPAGAPANYYSFTASPDTVKPVINHSPYTQIPKPAWPVTVNCVVTDNIGVDSVWVGWRKNFNGAYKRFNLARGSGNSWSGTFNSTNSEVAPGDTIYYRIIARDASSQQNKDSTVLYNPVIINQTTACIGTGTTSSNYPFTTYWMDGRTQILLLASEILANQGAAGNIIKVGFNVITADPAPMNGFKVQMQHTTATSLTGFVSTGWTTCYSGTYTLPGTGWQYINLTTPFLWNGTSNLLIEVCYNNSSWTAYSPVYATSATSMMVGQYSDLSTGDGCTQLTSPSVLTYRANTCLVINIANKVSNNTNGVPVEYKLSQNYPNPFNPVTKISFDIPKQGLVTLKIYDVLGREVRTLVNEVKNAGSYTVDFNAAELSSGVYFYKLEVNGFSDVKRMMLIK